MSTELAVTSAPSRATVMAQALVQAKEERTILGQYVAENLVDGTDYGIIPGTKNKTLLKPGAEKLLDLYRSVAEYTVTHRTEDWDRPLFSYEVSCKVIYRETGTVIASGLGSCNSREKKYRYRTADRVCPQCELPKLFRSKYPPRDNPNAEPGWYCYAAKGGCGANFEYDDLRIKGQTQGQVENTDVADQANTLLKMAKKRALVDATISLARCSDIFTQDVEDFHDVKGSDEVRHAAVEKLEAAAKAGPEALDATWRSMGQAARSAAKDDLVPCQKIAEQAVSRMVQEWIDWIASEPSIDVFNRNLPELAKIESATAKSRAKKVCEEHAKECGWAWNRKAGGYEMKFSETPA